VPDEKSNKTFEVRLKLKYIVRIWVPVIVWCAVIFVQSGSAAPDVVPRLPHIDKVVHAGVYGLLGFLVCRALVTVDVLRRRPRLLVALGTFAAALYGLSDEWHQSFVPERTADVLDLTADTIGGFIGSLVHYRWKMKKRGRREV
jgi:VanZ family protein